MDKREYLELMIKDFRRIYKENSKVDEFLRFVCDYDVEITSNDPIEIAKITGARNVYLRIKKLLKRIEEV